MRANKALFIAMHGKDASLSITQIVEEEIARNVIRCNGDNNKKELDKSKQGSWEWTYNSTGRNLVRMHWLCNFVKKILENLLTTEMTLVAACQDAYTYGFGDHHGWLVRKGAGLAMMAAGQKSAFIGRWGVNNIEEGRPALDNLAVLCERLNHLLGSKNLLDLP